VRRRHAGHSRRRLAFGETAAIFLNPAGISVRPRARRFSEADDACEQLDRSVARKQSVIRAALWRFKPRTPTMTKCKEDADHGSNQT
jgi:hypothetical protein